jgi:glycosyltransferase involved in cell wall biosynthesis
MMLKYSKKLNIVFTGEFTYPIGMAGTKRIQHLIDYLSIENTVKVFLFRQKINHPVSLKMEGKKGNVIYQNIGSEIGMSLKAIYLLLISILLGFITLWKWKIRGSKNILYVYIGITLENIIFVMFAKLIGYRIIVEYVEDFRHYAGNLSKGLAFKNKTNVFFERFLPYMTQGIVVISTYLYQKFEKYNKAIPLIHIPISSYVSGNLNQTPSFHSPVKIVYSGSFGAKDGLDSLIDAFNIFSKKYSNCELLLCGLTKNTEMIKKYCENPNIQYIGYIPDEEFDSFLSQADILCMTRNKMLFANAGFPFKLGEYLATGKPVIASKVSDVELYLENLHDAMLVEPERPDQIVDAFMFLIQNPNKAFEIGRNGLKKCIEHFNPVTNGKKLNDFMLAIK